MTAKSHSWTSRVTHLLKPTGLFQGTRRRGEIKAGRWHLAVSGTWSSWTWKRSSSATISRHEKGCGKFGVESSKTLMAVGCQHWPPENYSQTGATPNTLQSLGCCRCGWERGPIIGAAQDLPTPSGSLWSSESRQETAVMANIPPVSTGKELDATGCLGRWKNLVTGN